MGANLRVGARLDTPNVIFGGLIVLFSLGLIFHEVEWFWSAFSDGQAATVIWMLFVSVVVMLGTITGFGVIKVRLALAD
jgi:uncharacterized membrane protein YcjF (UPF0283 family)